MLHLDALVQNCVCVCVWQTITTDGASLRYIARMRPFKVRPGAMTRARSHSLRRCEYAHDMNTVCLYVSKRV